VLLPPSYGWCLLLAGQEDSAAAGCATAVEGGKLQQHVVYDYTPATLLLLRSIYNMHSRVAAEV
jgi:hypothetical protein